MPESSMAVSVGLYSSIQLSKFVAGLITVPKFEAINSLMTNTTDNNAEVMLFSLSCHQAAFVCPAIKQHSFALPSSSIHLSCHQAAVLLYSFELQK
jgi:hypothetical protein